MLKLKAPAKVNLFLKITAIRDDGYHELYSLFAFLDLADQLEITKSDHFSLAFDGKFAADLVRDVKNNILTKTIDLFHQQFAISKNLAIKLTKNIPISSGLGGGSSDSATLMKALNQIYNLKLGKKQLQEISLKLGSDIAFFFEDQACLSVGRGEVAVEYCNFKPIPALIINPNIALSTKEVYQKFDQEFSFKTANKIDFNHNLKMLRSNDVFSLIKSIDNDLLNPAVLILAEIREILSAIMGQNGCQIAKMSGSGASCFGVFLKDDDLDLAYDNLIRVFPSYFIMKSKIYSNYLIK
jgi:4-diphosphocytidyl-2-C-methyl-D-erythritol kinase